MRHVCRSQPPAIRPLQLDTTGHMAGGSYLLDFAACTLDERQLRAPTSNTDMQDPRQHRDELSLAQPAACIFSV
jgi:hypothetical protein